MNFLTLRNITLAISIPIYPGLKNEEQRFAFNNN